MNHVTKTIKGNGKLLLGALVGGAIGAAAGILFAPRSGKVTRSMIGEKYSEVTTSLRRKFKR